MPLERLKALNTTDCLWIYILRILKEGPTHAYTIRSEIRRSFGFEPGIMTAYKVLYQLHRKGLVTKTLEGRKKVYKITQKGLSHLKQASAFYSSLAKRLS